jgi:hypothetical protein
MSDTKQRAEPGWKVVGSKGKFIGTIEHVREDHLIVAQGRFIQHTLYIPISHVASSADGQVMLTLPATDADAQGWRFPPNAGFTHDAGDFWDAPVATSLRASGMGNTSGNIDSGMHDGKIDAEQLEDQSSPEDDTFAIPPDEKG